MHLVTTERADISKFIIHHIEFSIILWKKSDWWKKVEYAPQPTLTFVWHKFFIYYDNIDFMQNIYNFKVYVSSQTCKQDNVVLNKNYKN